MAKTMKARKIYVVNCWKLPMAGTMRVNAYSAAAAKRIVARSCGWFDPEDLENPKAMARITRSMEAVCIGKIGSNGKVAVE